jgi:hypothetical protein
MIPLIKPNITDDNEMRFILKCKCNIKNLTFELINKHYFSKNISKELIKNENLMEDECNDDSLIVEFNEFIDKLKNNNKFFLTLKNNFINFLQSKIEKIKKLFDKIQLINEHFEIISKFLINSYENINKNYSTIKNIKYYLNNEINTISEKDIKNIIIKNRLDKSIQNLKDIIYSFSPIPKKNENLTYISTLDYNYNNQVMLKYNKFILFSYKQTIYIHSMDLNNIAFLHKNAHIIQHIQKLMNKF